MKTLKNWPQNSWQFDFFSLQPRFPKTAQDRKFILEMCLKTHLFSNLCAAAAVSRYLIIITGSFLYMVTRVSHTSFREGPEGKGEIFCAASLAWVQK
jgi:hypothetical protein